MRRSDREIIPCTCKEDGEVVVVVTVETRDQLYGFIGAGPTPEYAVDDTEQQPVGAVADPGSRH